MATVGVKSTDNSCFAAVLKPTDFTKYVFARIAHIVSRGQVCTEFDQFLHDFETTVSHCCHQRSNAILHTDRIAAISHPLITESSSSSSLYLYLFINLSLNASQKNSHLPSGLDIGPQLGQLCYHCEMAPRSSIHERGCSILVAQRGRRIHSVS